MITRLPEVITGDYGDYVIPKASVCPYFGKEEREKWHREKGITDPKSPWGRLILADEPPKEESATLIEITTEKVPPVEESSLTKEQRYRLRNKEKLAAKARERRKK